MQNLQPVQPRTSPSKTFVSQDLDSCTHVFVRVDAVKKPLQQPYQGPFEVIWRTRKNFTINRNGTLDVIAIDRVKPAYLLNSTATTPDARPRNTSSVVPGRSKKTIYFLLPRN
ncbi:hypothetical protein GWK47_016155 [Chionoecetes opilio]|uniref:Uncharacterized protein n=1 Tax=Chionoecetes opilio TaxID=41210 RepID=A0A8J4XS30_CHIOP|nr:hypothetical protein GWK47_016155 [Chionoecetes opilio]